MNGFTLDVTAVGPGSWRRIALAFKERRKRREKEGEEYGGSLKPFNSECTACLLNYATSVRWPTRVKRNTTGSGVLIGEISCRGRNDANKVQKEDCGANSCKQGEKKALHKTVITIEALQTNLQGAL